MSSEKKEKICFSCEERIGVSVPVCPFCGAQQAMVPLQEANSSSIFEDRSLEDSLTSLYTPPYQGKRPKFESEPFEEGDQEGVATMLEEPLYKEVTDKRPIDHSFLGINQEEDPVAKSSFVPTLFLFAGLQFSLFGIVQLFFSKGGALRLQWNADYWFFYCLAGLPLLYYGVKKIYHLDS